MHGIKVLTSFKNYVILHNVNENKVYCYSYNKCIGCYDRIYKVFFKNKNVEFTPTNKKHFKLFQKSIDNGEFF